MSTTKYGTIRTPRWKWRHEQGNPHMSDHLLERWDHRTPIGACSPEHAWTHGVEVNFMKNMFSDRNGQQPDKAVYWSEQVDGVRYDIVLLVSNMTVTTVYRVDSIRNPKTRAALYGLRELIDDE